jgi:phosphate transport system substrate-binding protein
MKPYRFAIFTLISVALMLAACGNPQTPQPEILPTVVSKTNLVIAGSGGASTVLKYLADAYGSRNSELTFEFLSGSSSGGGVKGVLDRSLDLGVLSRPPKSTEVTSGIAFFAFASDQIAIATSSDLAIGGLTSQQLKDVFLGNITNWSEVGGPDAIINVIVRDEDESSTQILRAALFGEDAFAPGSIVFTSEGDLREALASLPNAIAFMSYGGLRLSDQNFPVLSIDGANPADLDSGYPYFRPLGVAFLPTNASRIQPFLDFISSPEALTLLAEKGIKPPQ